MGTYANEPSAMTPSAPSDSPAPTGVADFGTAAQERLLRRLTRRLLPFLMLCYLVAWLNRVNISFAALQMNTDIGLSAAQYGLGAGLFFITYSLLEVPSNLLLCRFGARRWIARIMASWGVCAVAMAFVSGPTSYYVLRLLLGAAEAGFYPGILFFLTLWFPRGRRGSVLGVFLAAIPITGIIGAPLSGALLSLNGTLGLHGWQWLFIVEGLPALVLAPIVLRYLQDDPSKATWLTAAERGWLAGTLGDEHRQLARRRSYSLAQALMNPRVLLLAGMWFSNACLMNGITFFLPQIVKGFGLSNLQTGFVVAIPNLLALLAMIWWGRRSDARSEHLGHATLANLVGGVALLLAMLLGDPVLETAAVSVAFACTLAFVAPFWVIPGTFLSGAPAAGGIAAISAIGVLGGFFTPWAIGLIRDRTGDFRGGEIGVACLALLVSVVFYVVGGRQEAAAMKEVQA
jgi:sugar phosphate permease